MLLLGLILQNFLSLKGFLSFLGMGSGPSVVTPTTPPTSEGGEQGVGMENTGSLSGATKGQFTDAKTISMLKQDYFLHSVICLCDNG